MLGDQVGSRIQLMLKSFDCWLHGHDSSHYPQVVWMATNSGHSPIQKTRICKDRVIQKINQTAYHEQTSGWFTSNMPGQLKGTNSKKRLRLGLRWEDQDYLIWCFISSRWNGLTALYLAFREDRRLLSEYFDIQVLLDALK